MTKRHWAIELFRFVGACILVGAVFAVIVYNMILARANRDAVLILHGVHQCEQAEESEWTTNTYENTALPTISDASLTH